MQGRLLPKFNNRFQAHPVGYWKDEFILASSFELDLIEFILDNNDLLDNPLSSLSGINEIKSVSLNSGVSVHSICADYFMVAPLQRVHRSVSVLEELIDASVKLGVRNIVIPCVDEASLGTDEAGIRAFLAAAAAGDLYFEYAGFRGIPDRWWRFFKQRIPQLARLDSLPRYTFLLLICLLVGYVWWRTAFGPADGTVVSSETFQSSKKDE